jgi:hypothetical protein
MHELPFVTTIHVLNSLILKLSRNQAAEKVYRGAKVMSVYKWLSLPQARTNTLCFCFCLLWFFYLKGGVLPDEFWDANEHGVKGGIELAFMSTTLDRKVATSFATGTGKDTPSIVFEIQMGMVSTLYTIHWHQLQLQYTRVYPEP